MKLSRVCVLSALYFAAGLEAQTAPSADSNFLQPVSELDQTLPKWLQLSGSDRVRVEDQEDIGFKANHSDFHVLNQLWLGVSIRPESWLSFFGQAQDSRIFLNGVVADAPPLANTWDLHQAWVQLGGVEKYPVAVRVGRQELNFGEQRLVGASPWLNAPRVFDAALVTVRLADVRIDTFASSVVNSVNGEMDHHKQGNPFYGTYFAFGKLIPNASVEPYFFWRISPVGFGPAYASGAKGRLDEGTLGLRIAGKLPWRFDYGAEMARQAGTLGADKINAWGGHWIAGRTFETFLKPRIFLEYNYASGTSNPKSNEIATFDQLYPSGHDKFGETDQVGWRNIRDLRTGLDTKPFRKLTISAIYHNYWLANAHDGLYTALGTVVAKSLAGTAGTHVGQEADVEGIYQWNKAVKFGAGYGRLFTGEFLNRTTNGRDFSYPYFLTSYAF
jgi:hypothetical protein